MKSRADTARTIPMTHVPDLQRLGGSLPLGVYVREVWRRRQFATVVPLSDLRAQNMDTVLGNVWHLLNPMLLVGVYFLVFGVILDTSRGVDNFILFLAVGVFVFHYTQKSVMAGSSAIVSNEGLLRSMQFPRAILPISTVVGQSLAFLPTVAVAVAVALATGEPVRVSWLALPVIFALQAVFNLGAVFAVARATDAFRDTGNILPYVFRILFYMSGVLYSVDHIVENDAYQRLFELNPMYVFITLARWPFLGTTPTAGVWASAVAWSIGLFVVAFLWFRAAEHRYGRG